jgi:hypothetical protein
LTPSLPIWFPASLVISILRASNWNTQYFCFHIQGILHSVEPSAWEILLYEFIGIWTYRRC